MWSAPVSRWAPTSSFATGWGSYPVRPSRLRAHAPQPAGREVGAHRVGRTERSGHRSPPALRGALARPAAAPGSVPGHRQRPPRPLGAGPTRLATPLSLERYQQGDTLWTCNASESASHTSRPVNGHSPAIVNSWRSRNNTPARGTARTTPTSLRFRRALPMWILGCESRSNPGLMVSCRIRGNCGHRADGGARNGSSAA